MRKITVGFLGCGNIGCGVWKLLHEFEGDLQHRSNVAFEIKKYELEKQFGRIQ